MGHPEIPASKRPATRHTIRPQKAVTDATIMLVAIGHLRPLVYHDHES